MKPEQLKNILPLYLGQKVEINGNTVPFASIDFTGHITYDAGKGQKPLRYISLVSFLESGKLLLRPLSSMTEEEARGLCEVMGVKYHSFDNSWGYIEVMFTEIVGEDTTGITIYNDGTFSVNGNSDVFPFLTIPHLTALGFDCFNLIGLGIAKDSTQIKPPQKVTYEVTGVSLTTGGENVFVFNEAEYKEFKKKKHTHYPAWRFTKTERKQIGL